MERLDQGSLYTLVKQPVEHECYPAGIQTPDPTILGRTLYQRAI
jgi:hypothetical protein